MTTQNALNRLGQLLVKAKVAHLDHEVLIGALLEISEKSKDENFLKACREKSQKHLKASNKENAITISFKSPPSTEYREKLKELNFKWNSFRGEYYGFGDKSTISVLFNNQDCKIEIIE